MRIKELINGFRNRGDPRIKIELDLERIMEIVGEETEVFENLYLTRELYLSLALISGKGVFVIVPYRDQTDAAKGREIRRCLGICAANSCIAFCKCVQCSEERIFQCEGAYHGACIPGFQLGKGSDHGDCERDKVLYFCCR